MNDNSTIIIGVPKSTLEIEFPGQLVFILEGDYPHLLHRILLKALLGISYRRINNG